MKERNTQAQDQVFTREQALWHAAWLISRVREKVAELYGWAVAGEATSAFTPLILAQEVHAALQEALTFARAFADYQSFEQSVHAFLEEARLEAARILREKEPAQPAGEEEVPF
ncbi:hypothetical protein [Thermus amyloliquefaciens]|uniref:hypothetical protein n=1 Tax=Thermus amyloliquefaciens TaxID=1449080 RepID=UPI00056F4FD7|nr:hypothetical protein [Thermus amyloliquefaciens]